MRVATVLILSALFFATHSFNVSPSANLILKIPQNKFTNENRSSYFGFSLNLRKTHILIGAPRANSSLPSHENITEPGQVYRCTFDNEHCEVFYMNQKKQPNELKDNQFFGFSMDGHETEKDKFVACAPKYAFDTKTEHFMFGACYYTENTATNFENQTEHSIIPLNDENKYFIHKKSFKPTKKFIQDVTSLYYVYGENGFSVHVTDNKQEVITGCPGIFDWKGTINKHDFATRQNIVSDITKITTGYSKTFASETYLGYAVTSGQFLWPDKKIIYVSSAPRTDNDFGIVVLYTLLPGSKTVFYNNIHQHFASPQNGSYFGYALLCDDFNNDGKPDLAVSAPFHAFKGSYDNGAVFIYFNDGSNIKTNGRITLKFKKPINITLEKFRDGDKFGMAMGKIGDINHDGFNDLAIASVSLDKEAIYIYHGGAKGFKLSQKIEMPDRSSMFGFSISRGVDIDGNGYNDIAVGAPNSDEVFIYKTYPIMKVIATLNPSKIQVELTDNLVINACIKIKPKFNFPVEFNITLNTTSDGVTFKNSTVTNLLVHDESCKSFKVDVKIDYDPKSVSKPILFDLEFDTIKKIPKDVKEFCNTCVLFEESAKKRKKLELPVNTNFAPDLKLIATLNETEKFIVGSSKVASIKFAISNSGEAAYYSKLTITIPSQVKFLAVPSICEQSHQNLEMICQIESEHIKNNQTLSLDILLDISDVRDNLIEIFAVASCSGNEKTPSDNSVTLKIHFDEQSLIEIEESSETHIDILKDDLMSQQLKYVLQIINHGPSPIKNLELNISLPQTFINKNKRHELIKMKRIDCSHLDCITKWETDNKLNEKDTKFENISYSKSIQFDCNQTNVECAIAMVKIKNFEPSLINTIEVVVEFDVVKKEIDKVLNETASTMIIRTILDLKSSSSYNVTAKNFEIKIKKIISEETPLYIYIAAIIGGIVFLIAIIVILAKCGFFQRKIKQELVKIKRESMMFPQASRLMHQHDEVE